MIAASLATFVLSGCVSYEPSPINLETYDQDWLKRSLDPANLQPFAQAMGSAIPSGEGEGLTLNDAIVVALYGNPSLRHVRLEAGVELASANHAGLWDDPELSFDLMRNVDTGSDPWIYGASLGFTVPLSGRLDVERDQAWSDYESAWYDVVIAEWEMIRSLTRDWAQWSATWQQVRLMFSVIQDLDALIESANSLVELGAMAPAEARLLEIERMQHGMAMVRLEFLAEQQKRALIATMGLRPGVLYTLIPQVQMPEVDVDTQSPSPQTHPRVLGAMAAYEQAEQTLRREMFKQYPDLTIGPAFENEEGQSRIGLGFGIPLPILNANVQGIAEATAAREAAHAQVDLTYQEAAAELDEAAANLRAATRMRVLVETELLPLTAKQVEEAQRLLELGEIDVLLLSRAVAAAADARLMLFELLAEETQAALDYEILTNPRWATQPEMRVENE